MQNAVLLSFKAVLGSVPRFLPKDPILVEEWARVKKAASLFTSLIHGVFIFDRCS